MSRNIITGIDIGSSTIQITVAEERDGVLHILSVNRKPSDGIKHGYVINQEDAVKSIQETIRAAEKTIGSPIKDVFISVNGISLGSVKSKGSIIISKADGEVAENDVNRVISQSESNIQNMANRRIIHTLPISFKIDGKTIFGRPAGMTGNKLEVETISITCLSQHLTDLIKTIESAGISIEDIFAAPLAISQAVLSKKQKDVGCALVDIGSSTMSVVVFEEGNLISLETFPIGSMHITNDIALGFQISLAEAEKLKFDFGGEVPVSKRKLSDIIEARLSDIFELVENHLKKINRDGMLPGGIVLTGGGSSLFSLDEIAKACLKLPSKIGTIKNNDSLKITAPPNIQEQIFTDPSWSTSVGLCISAMEDGSGEFRNGKWGLWQKISQGIKNIFHSLTP